MTLNIEATRSFLREFDFEALFIEELGWDYFDDKLSIIIDEDEYSLEAIAEKRGVVAFLCDTGDNLPLHAVRRKIDRKVAKSFREHFIIFIDSEKSQQIWQWVRQEPGRPLSSREHIYRPEQSGLSLIQKLQAIAISLDEEDNLTLVDVTGRLRAAFNVERATKRFYDRFKKERKAFEDFMEGIDDLSTKQEYVSVMLNRLMFIYFLQQKAFLDGNIHYLRNRMRIMQDEFGSDQFYSFYRYFLLRLFHEGLGKVDHATELEKLIGKVPYLNGGIFEQHTIEQEYPDIQIPDEAFERILDFFDQYQWHLDDRPLHDDSEINPDVLGYIFEKYINQKQMGAYYTKEDITEYISRNTIIPYLFDTAAKEAPDSFSGEDAVWSLLKNDPRRYIFPAMQKGVNLPVPGEIATGIDDVSKRDNWNTHTPEEYALPTEIWRETIERRMRFQEVEEQLAAGEISDINQLITLNLDIQQFSQDVIENIETPETLRAFWNAIREVTVLDPTCGSGAFLFAALNILEPLYEASLNRMEHFWVEMPEEGIQDFKEALDEVDQHPNKSYYILKSIVIRNLYGVDIMPEAVEIAKLRLFLKLVSQVNDVNEIEPLPDIDFNIRTGNTLVGYVTRDEVRDAVLTGNVGGVQTNKLFAFPDETEQLERIEKEAVEVESLFQKFHSLQTNYRNNQALVEFSTTKTVLLAKLNQIRQELDSALANQYAVNSSNQKKYDDWLASHQPFHWFIEFYGIMQAGGFDVIVGNPPYVEYSKVRKTYTIQNFQTEEAGNLFVFVTEQAISRLLKKLGRVGLILPISFISVNKTIKLRKIILEKTACSWYSNYAIRPAKLFEGVEQRLTIFLGTTTSKSNEVYATKYWQWYKDERPILFQRIRYCSITSIAAPSFIPKISSDIQASIIQKIRTSHNEVVDQYIKQYSSIHLFFHRTPGYWIRMMDFEPYFKSPTQNRSIHHIRDLTIDNLTIAKFIGAMISSSLFFFYFFASGNCRNLTLNDVKSTAIGSPPEDVLEKIGQLFDDLMVSYKDNSEIKRRGNTEFQEFDWAASKPIIDHIDKVLAMHYHLTDLELDFITNYDIKIRMGSDLNNI